jgi:type IV secretion system protein VirB1
LKPKGFNVLACIATSLFLVAYNVEARVRVDEKVVEEKLMPLFLSCAPLVGPKTMIALTAIESDWREFSIGINGPTKLVREIRNRREAIVTLNDLLRKKRNVDIGYAQINSRWLRPEELQKLKREFDREDLVVTTETIFDPCTNVAMSEMVLVSCHRRAKKNPHIEQTEQSLLRAALSCYNTGNFSGGYSNGYIRRFNRAVIRRNGR